MRSSFLAFAIAGISAVHPAAASPRPAAVDAALREMTGLCRSAGGRPVVSKSAVSRADLRGMGKIDWIVDERGIACDGAASIMAGAAGFSLYLIPADGRSVRSMPAQAWSINAGRPPIIHLHGGFDCAASKTGRCAVELQWNGMQFVNINPRGAR